MHKSAVTLQEPLANPAAFNSTLRGILARVRNAVSVEIPTGYQDENGFHSGVKPSEKEIQWPPVW